MWYIDYSWSVAVVKKNLHLLPVPPQATAEANNLTAQAAAFDRYNKEMDAVRHRHTHLANTQLLASLLHTPAESLTLLCSLCAALWCRQPLSFS